MKKESHSYEESERVVAVERDKFIAMERERDVVMEREIVGGVPTISVLLTVMLLQAAN